MKHQILIISLLLSIVYTYGQQELYMTKEIKKAYSNGTRSEDGEPGKNYFQNSWKTLLGLYRMASMDNLLEF